jgi:uncharacterized membrane protein
MRSCELAGAFQIESPPRFGTEVFSAASHSGYRSSAFLSATLMRILFWILLVVVCLSIGAYPLRYLLADGRIGLLQTKSDALLRDGWWRLGFYAHIVGGGIALSVGWTQFMKSWRKRNLRLHRFLGKLYVLMVCVSGVAAVYIAFNTSTGWVAGLGFGSLGVVWLFSTLQAYRSVRQGDLRRHECLMIYSYSACFAAVTLRFWLPLMMGVFRLDFALAYPIVAWLCWVPNMLVARWMTSGSQ